MSILTKDLDKHPYTGERKVIGKLRVKTSGWTEGFFNGNPDYEQVRGITPGKTYDVLRKIGLGDVEDVIIIDDFGNEAEHSDFLFEEIE